MNGILPQIEPSVVVLCDPDVVRGVDTKDNYVEEGVRQFLLDFDCFRHYDDGDLENRFRHQELGVANHVEVHLELLPFRAHEH